MMMTLVVLCCPQAASLFLEIRQIREIQRNPVNFESEIVFEARACKCLGNMTKMPWKSQQILLKTVFEFVHLPAVYVG